jgi:hypothetical protein
VTAVEAVPLVEGHTDVERPSETAPALTDEQVEIIRRVLRGGRRIPTT